MAPHTTAVLPVDRPAPTSLDVLARRDRCRAADDRDKIITPLHLHPQHGKTALRIVKSDPLDESVQSFGHGQEAAARFAVE